MSTEPDPAAEPALFNYKRKKKPKLPTDTKLGEALQFLMFKVYATAYRQRFGTFPLTTKRDFATLKTLTLKFGAPTVEQYIRAFLMWNGEGDKWVLSEGWTIQTLFARWNKVTMLIRGNRPPFQCEHQPSCQSAADHSQRNLQDLRTT